MADRETVASALTDTDWSSAQVENEPKPTSVVFAVRVPSGLAEWIAGESDRRGVNPSVVIRDAIAAASRTTVDDKPVTVRLSDLHRAIDGVVGPAA